MAYVLNTVYGAPDVKFGLCVDSVAIISSRVTAGGGAFGRNFTAKYLATAISA
jgi:hypothetical protein